MFGLPLMITNKTLVALQKSRVFAALAQCLPVTSQLMGEACALRVWFTLAAEAPQHWLTVCTGHCTQSTSFLLTKKFADV